jgi:hypothetical protein
MFDGVFVDDPVTVMQRAGEVIGGLNVIIVMIYQGSFVISHKSGLFVFAASFVDVATVSCSPLLGNNVLLLLCRSWGLEVCHLIFKFKILIFYLKYNLKIINYFKIDYNF